MSTTQDLTETVLRTGRLVCWNVTTNQRDVVVQPRTALDALCVDTALTDAGWRLAVSQRTDSGLLVRVTGTVRRLAAWAVEVADVEVAEVDTCVVEVDGRPVLVAGVGDRVNVRAVARVD